MCLNDVVRLVEVSADGSSAVGESAAGRHAVSLVVLVLDGVRPAIGDWVVVSTGLAVERLTDDEAAAVTRWRAQLAPAPVDQDRNDPTPTAPEQRGTP